MEPEGHSFCPYHDPPCTLNECVEAAVVAGSDIADGSEYNDALADAVASGNLTLGDAQQRLYNALLIRFRLGLFDPVEGQPYLAYGEEKIAAAAADNALAARQSLVLLQRGALPFARGGAGATAVLGFCGNSTGALVSNYVNQFCPGGGSTCFPSLLQAIGALGEATVFARACDSPTSCPAAEAAAAVAAAGAAATGRVVLCLGISQAQEGEQHDRVNITLPEPQRELFAAVAAAAAGKPLAVVLVHGGALAVPELKASGVALLDAFYPGPEGGGAIADALFGAYNPGGKLPYSVPDVGFASAYDMADMRIAEIGRTYRYRTATSPGGAPLWPFGFGLSYSEFSLSGGDSARLTLTPAAAAATVSVRVANIGAVAGDEVLQAYVAADAASLAAPQPPYVPVRSLVFFQRLRHAAGEGATVDVPLDAFACNLTLSDGSRRPVSGNYTLILSRGMGVGAEVAVPLTLSGWW